MPHRSGEHHHRGAAVTIRPARLEDVPAVLPMVGRTCALHESLDPAKYGFLPEPQRRYERWLAERTTDPSGVFLVAQAEDGRLVGFLVGASEREIPIYRTQAYGFFHDLWVEPAYRRAGVARQLVMQGVQRFAQLGLSQVRLDVSVRNEPALRLFESCGFRPAVVEMLVELKGRRP